ncbi:BRO-N domain-containing protein [Pseudaminobacter soli (ex Li et al. 2025)]|uniref:BRO family protein n=1 Tax=Pseudaminobacter soli (ex Li et al. 2025) TaxID=1295366 RepID=A0A2P7S2C5_9HYPH|nr:BRO family protein [Mesorhizobium soli]PSJ56614.1 BRO family protein [Mesorhizobium soli]
MLIAGEPWFADADIRRALDVAKHGKRLNYLASDEFQVVRKCGKSSLKGRGLTVVSESGFYKLVLRSTKSEAHKFQDWVTREVLPSIRKTGGYLLNEEARKTAHADDRQSMPLPELFAQVMQEAYHGGCCTCLGR